MRTPRLAASLLALTCLIACRSKSPDDDADGDGSDSGDTGTDDDGGATGPGTTDDGGDGTGTGTSGDAGCDPADIPEIDESGCAPLDTDYQPRVDMSANDMWPECVTDDGTYTLVASTPSSIARVEAFEIVADLLWRGDTPSEDDFTTARDAYSEMEGLLSRVIRREDLHYPPIPEEDHDPGVDVDKQCTVTANVEKYPDRCAGPAKIAPLVGDAFAAGQTGDGDPLIHAARIEAGLLWFFYISAYKECFTCTLAAKDCDSCWAYYTGGHERDGGIGLSAEVAMVSDEAHQSIWDGFTAVRCWRDLYPEDTYPTWDDVPSDGQDLHGLGWEQLDNALHRGFAVVVRDRLAQQTEVCGTPEGEANWAFLQVAGPVLDREADERGAAEAGTLADLWALDAPTIADVEAGIAALDAVFPCPQP